jgi:arylsulfatase A-like enzyme
VIFASDNGAEYIQPYDGWAGPWRGQYFTAWEGGIRVPFMIRWPGKVPAARVSDQIVHGVDLFPTLAHIVGASVPDDRPIDGVDQSDFILGKTEKSAREGILIWVDNRLQAVKWHNFKLHFYQQDNMMSPPMKLPIPLLIDLYTNPAGKRKQARLRQLGDRADAEDDRRVQPKHEEIPADPDGHAGPLSATGGRQELSAKTQALSPWVWCAAFSRQA